MASILSIALSGMNAAQMQLQTSAHNIATMATQGFARQETALSAKPEGGVQAAVQSFDLLASAPGDAQLTEVATHLQAKNAFLANLAVFKAHDKTIGALLNQHA